MFLLCPLIAEDTFPKVRGAFPQIFTVFHLQAYVGLYFLIIYLESKWICTLIWLKTWESRWYVCHFAQKLKEPMHNMPSFFSCNFLAILEAWKRNLIQLSTWTWCRTGSPSNLQCTCGIKKKTSFWFLKSLICGDYLILQHILAAPDLFLHWWQKGSILLLE